MKTKNLIIIIITGLFLLLIAFFISNYLIWQNYWQQRIYPQTKIGDLNLGGKTMTQARNVIKARIKKIENPGLAFRYDTKVLIIPTAVASFDADLSYSLLNFNISKILVQAYGNRKQRTFKYYLLNNYRLINPRIIKATYTLNQNKIKTVLQDDFPELNIPAISAYFSVTNTNNGTKYQLQINPEELGRTIDYNAVLKTLNYNLANLDNNQIIIKTYSNYPKIKQSDLIDLKPEVKKIINRGNLSLHINTPITKYWEINPDEIITWISIENIKTANILSFNQNKIEKYLKIHIAPSINKAAIKPQFKIINNKLSNWQNGTNGRQLDLTASAAQITKNFFAGKNNSNLIIKELPDESLMTGHTSDIKEILGIGQSNFRGSPVNRVHNIEVGAADLQGLLIKPGETFSLVKALGEIDAKTGYLQELVIKGHKTVPEYGGGLCQIATTLFRTALAAGLPITMRENHSYQVGYYAPAGTDATIYDPLPDLRFINNTKHYILIQARIVKNKLYFDFWGTSDGRIATTSAPVIYNIVKPEPTKIIKTDTLKPGKRKCTEDSHNGADAYFDYTVTYPANSTTTPVHKRRFYSHYVPWQAVCLVGEASTSTVPTNNPKLKINFNKKAIDFTNASSSKF